MMFQRAAAIGLFCGMLASAGGAPAATCTVTDMRIFVGGFGDLRLEGTVARNGLALPATVDEAAGTMAIDLTSFPPTPFEIVVDNQLAFEPGIYTGTLDGAGDVFIPGVQMNLTTVFGGGSVIPAVVDLSTGLSSMKVAGQEAETAGTPLAFTTGAVVLEGQAFLAAAPGAPSALTAGLHLGCTLAPVPDRTKLSAGSVLARTAAKAKLAPAGGSDPPSGDVLSKLTAKLTTGAAALDPAHGVFILIRDASDADVLLIRSDVTLKGKKATVVDKDPNGTSILVLKGRKRGATQSAPLQGKLVLKQTKKALLVSLTESGIDLSTLAGGSATVTVGVGSTSASHAVQVTRKAKSLRFH